MNNLEPWLNNDLAGQEAEGEKVGYQHASEGWCVDSSDGPIKDTDTPYMKGYKRGWDKFQSEGKPIVPKVISDEERKARLKKLTEYWQNMTP